MYEPGQVIDLYADIFPAGISPAVPGGSLPPGMPTSSAVTLRVLLSQEFLTIGWQVGAGARAQIERVDIPMTAEQMLPATYRGGVIGGYKIGPVGGCRCRAPAMSGWDPFPGVIKNVVARADQARAVSRDPAAYGLVPRRYSSI